ncbi:MAG: LLM class flavin-dependent oxidoreductase [Candidatus Bathyarchaeia archaeon]|nr:LLM class flavin-dependent oxidoreductase [Candidatus Bathyarchaeota archaeon]
MFELGVNFNTDLPINYIINGVKIAEKYGYDYVWIGESIQHPHPIPIAALISKVTERIKIGIIISPKINRSIHIVKSIQTLLEVYGERYAIGLVPGDTIKLEALGLKTFNILKEMHLCIKSFPRTPLFKINFNGVLPKLCRLRSLPIYIGASGPKMINEGSKIADGLLLNYINPEFIKWCLKFVDVENCCITAFGPVLLKPAKEELLMALRISTAIIASGANKSFIKNFNMDNEVEEVKRVFIKNNFDALKKYDEFLIEKFAIYGNLEEIKNKIEELKRIGVDQVIFGAPFCKNLEAIKIVGESLK